MWYNLAMIRRVRKDDFKAILEMENDLHRQHVVMRPDTFNAEYEAYHEDTFMKLLNREECLFLVYEDKGEVVAYIYAEIITRGGVFVEGKIIYINDLYVKKPYRKKGIGQKLLSEIEKIAHELKITTIELMVWEGNENALRFYEEAGYKNRSYIKEKKIT